MPKSKIASPARSEGALKVSQRHMPRSSRSVGSPAQSTASGRLSTVIDQFKEQNRDSFPLSPFGKSVLPDDTDIDQPRRASWYKKVDNSRVVSEVLNNNDNGDVDNNFLEELDFEVLSQEKKEHRMDLPDSSGSESISSIVIPQRKLFTQKDNAPQTHLGKIITSNKISQEKKEHRMDLPDSSGSESISSIVRPQRKLFTQKENVPQNRFSQIIRTRESLTEQNKTHVADKTTEAGPRNLFNNEQREKFSKAGFARFVTKRATPVFPTALLNFSPEKTTNETKEQPTEVKTQARNLFGNRPVMTKRKNMYADFILSDSEDDVSGIQPKLFAFQQNSKPVRHSSVRRSSARLRENLSSSFTTDIDIDDWKLLPSSTMVEHQIVAAGGITPGKTTRLSKLSEATKEVTNSTANKMNQSNKSNSKNKSKTSLSLLEKSKNKKHVEETPEVTKEDKQGEEDEDADQEAEQRDVEIDTEQQLENYRNNEQEVEQDEDEVDKESEEIEQEVSDNEGQNETRVVQDEEEEEIVNASQEIEEHSEEEDNDADIQNESAEIENEEQNEDDNQEENEEQNESQEVQDDDEEEIMNASQEIEEHSEEEDNNADIQNESAEIENEEENEDDNQEENEEQNESQEVQDDEKEEIMNASQEIEEHSEEDNGADIQNESVETENEEENEDDNQDENEEENEDDNQEENEEENESREVQDDEENEIELKEYSEEEEDNDADIQNESAELENEEENEDDNQEENESKENSDDQEDQEQNEEDTEQTASETPNVSHDTTGRNRNKDELKSPEAILHNVTNLRHSFVAKGRNTSVRKTESIFKDTHRSSLAPIGESTGISDGTTNSSAAGSGWDSHRTTRKTLRQTFGKDFTPRKSLRTLVMEKSAKRQTAINEANAALYLQDNPGNSTEMESENQDEIENEDNGASFEQSDHEVSARTRQTTLEMYLQKIKKENIERRQKIEEQVKNSLKFSGSMDVLNRVSNSNQKRRVNAKPLKTAPKKRVMQHLISLEDLPPEFAKDLKYKPPKRYQLGKVSWVTKRLYNFLESKLEPRYNYKARVRAEKLVEMIYEFSRDVQRRKEKVAPARAVADLKREMARLNIVKTHFEFYNFFHDYMPLEVKIKVVPDIINDIPVPINLFGDIIEEN